MPIRHAFFLATIKKIWLRFLVMIFPSIENPIYIFWGFFLIKLQKNTFILRFHDSITYTFYYDT